MRMTLTALVRLIAFMAIGSTMVAVGVSRAVPKPGPELGLSERTPRYVGVNGSAFSPPRPSFSVIDTGTGELQEVALPNGVTFDYATCTPWHGERVEYELVGRMVERVGKATDQLCEGASLVRIDLTTREEISRSSLIPLVTGSPCWLNGSPSRVVFPAGDGQLYLQVLGDDDASTPEQPTERLLVAWAADLAKHHGSIINDVVRPIVTALNGKLLVAISHRTQNTTRAKLGRSEIWWLSLNAAGTQIVEAKPLFNSGSRMDENNLVEERLPNMIATPDGRLALAYLRREPRSANWELAVVEVRLDAMTGDPIAQTAECRPVASESALSLPAFSADGRWLYHLPKRLEPGAFPTRLPVSELLRQKHSSASH